MSVPHAVMNPAAPVWIADDVTDFVLMSGVRCECIKGWLCVTCLEKDQL